MVTKKPLAGEFRPALDSTSEDRTPESGHKRISEAQRLVGNDSVIGALGKGVVACPHPGVTDVAARMQPGLFRSVFSRLN
jgi:hypothetical protein